MVYKQLKRIYILIITIFCVLQAHSSTTYIKISPLDCLTCTANLDKVTKAATNYILVMDAEYIDDSIGIIKKYGLKSYKEKMVWDSELYNQLSRSDMSEVVQFCNGKEVMRQRLKTLSRFQELICEEGISHTQSSLTETLPIKAISKEDCNYDVPNHFTLKDFKKYVILRNYVTDDMFFLDKTNEKLSKLQQDDSLIKLCYLKKFNDDQKFHIYQQAKSNNSRLNPKVTSATQLNDSTLAYCLMTYNIDSVINGDTYFGKMLSIITMKGEHLLSVMPVNTNVVSAKLSINEYEMLCYNGSIYFGLTGNPRILDKEDFKLLARFENNNSEYQLEQIEDYNLDDFAIENGIYYNLSTPKQSHQFVGFSIADFYIDLKNKKKNKLPFEKSVFESNKEFMQVRKANYILEDMAYSPEKNILTFYYQMNGYEYVSQLVPGSNKFLNTIRLFPVSYFNDYIINTALKEDGSKILFVRKGENCIEECDFQSIEETIKNRK